MEKVAIVDLLVTCGKANCKELIDIMWRCRQAEVIIYNVSVSSFSPLQIVGDQSSYCSLDKIASL